MALLLGTLLALSTRGARAQTDDGAPPGYREVIAAAIDEYEAQSYAEAREQFRRAHKLFPNARTLRGLGVTEYELHNYPEAVRYLEQALAAEVKPLTGNIRTETELVLARARGYVGTVQLAIEPSSARVLVDNERVQNAQEALLLPVGDHVIDVSASGRLSERRAISVQGGQTQVLQITLVEAEQPAGNMPRERETPTPVYKQWWLWTSVAVVAGGAVAATLWLTRTEKRREVAQGSDNTPPGAPGFNPFAVEFGR